VRVKQLRFCCIPSAAMEKAQHQFSTKPSKKKKNSQLTPMLKHLLSKIKSTGPITVAEYMREVLTNPVMGYHLHKDMVGADGDFVTSPEISQIFEELLGVWCMAAGKPKAFQMVELRPGRDTLTSDVLRVSTNFSLLKSEVSVHLVEVSPKLSEVPAQVLMERKRRQMGKGATKAGFPVFWYRDLQDVLRGYAFYLAHEFNALPIHKFQKTEQVLLDMDPQVPHNFCFVLVSSPTMASKTLLQAGEKRELCLGGGVIIQRLTDRISEHGGAVLIADYRHTGTKTDTFRGFCGQKLPDVLTASETPDLTADVDFSYLQRMRGKVATLGPITQQQFLRNMGIESPITSAAEKLHIQQLKHLTDGYDMLMIPKEMGERFKFFSLLPHSKLSTPTKEKKSSNKHGPPSPPVVGFRHLAFE
uniref:Protein arginine methyltransferase NDUFAF7 n=1 Tax=Latimeria chalumnae TaxID=7897 RepID=H3AFM2_LATCH